MEGRWSQKGYVVTHLLFETSLQFWWRAPCTGHPDQTIHKDVSAWQIFYQNVRRILMTKRFPSTKTNITAILHSSVLHVVSRVVTGQAQKKKKTSEKSACRS